MIQSTLHFDRRWICGPNLHIPRAFLQVANTGNRLFVVGGAGRSQGHATPSPSPSPSPSATFLPVRNKPVTHSPGLTDLSHSRDTGMTTRLSFEQSRNAGRSPLLGRGSFVGTGMAAGAQHRSPAAIQARGMHAVSSMDVWDNELENWVFKVDMEIPCHGHAVVSDGRLQCLSLPFYNLNLVNFFPNVVQFSLT
jgi:hypothetical protein